MLGDKLEIDKILNAVVPDLGHPMHLLGNLIFKCHGRDWIRLRESQLGEHLPDLLRNRNWIRPVRIANLIERHLKLNRAPRLIPKRQLDEERRHQIIFRQF